MMIKTLKFGMRQNSTVTNLQIVKGIINITVYSINQRNEKKKNTHTRKCGEIVIKHIDTELNK